MELERKTKDDIKDLMGLYTGSLYEISFFKNVIAILNEDILFRNQISIKCCENCIGAETNLETAEISCSKNFDRYIHSMLKPLLIDDEKEYQLYYNFYYLNTIFHEVSHAYQVLASQNRIDMEHMDKKIRELYAEMIERYLCPKNIIRKKIRNYFYKKVGTDFAFERNANILAMQNLIDLYDDEEMKTFVYSLLFDYYLLGYKKVNLQIFSPVYNTFKILGGKEVDLSFSQSLPLITRINEGLPITIMEYYKLNESMNRKIDNLEEYETTLSLLRRM